MSTSVDRPKVTPTEQLDALDDFRVRCAELFDALPQPPIYRRADDPARASFAQLTPRVDALLTEAGRFKSSVLGLGEAGELSDALVAMRETIHLASQDQFNLAEEAWLRFLRLRARALSSRKIWRDSEDKSVSVFDRTTGTSRFDATEQTGPTVQLVCPNRQCGKAGFYRVPLTAGRREFNCSHCGKPFVGYLAEAIDVNVDAKSRGKTRYAFRLGETSGTQTKTQFEDGGSAVLRVARGDNLALIYAERNELRGALNLNTGRILWLKRAGACFVASAVFGINAPELVIFRAFRDEFLEAHWQGRVFIGAYYGAGPTLVRCIQFLRLTALARRLLLWLHSVLQKRGY